MLTHLILTSFNNAFVLVCVFSESRARIHISIGAGLHHCPSVFLHLRSATSDDVCGLVGLSCYCISSLNIPIDAGLYHCTSVLSHLGSASIDNLLLDIRGLGVIN